MKNILRGHLRRKGFALPVSLFVVFPCIYGFLSGSVLFLFLFPPFAIPLIIKRLRDIGRPEYLASLNGVPLFCFLLPHVLLVFPFLSPYYTLLRHPFLFLTYSTFLLNILFVLLLLLIPSMKRSDEHEEISETSRWLKIKKGTLFTLYFLVVLIITHIFAETYDAYLQPLNDTFVIW